MTTVLGMPQVDINSTSIHYESAGNGSPVLFIHGLGSSARDWERQVDFFAGSHRVITLDLRGHGRSEKPPGRYTIELLARDVSGLIDHLGLSPVSVVGISLGGMVTFQLAADRPDVIDKLVVVNALPDNALLQQARGEIRMRKFIIRFLGLQRMGKVLGARLFPDPDMEEERSVMANRWAQNDKKAYLNSFEAIVDWPGVTARLKQFDRPTLMISSDQDYVALEQKQPYLDALPRIRHAVIDNAHHAVPMERPEQFNRVLAEFLSG
ncbi:MAG: alpha/beta fold hydrolase [Acidimicrobiia bacterium]